MENYQSLIDEIRSSKKFQELSKIGGHKEYHLEGNALVHTDLVVSEAEHKFGKGHFMVLVALLHDIGKIYTSINNEPENPNSMNWSYPHHSDGGAKRLNEFIPETMKEFKSIQWYIFNHIQPLFWIGKDINVEAEKIMSHVPNNDFNHCKMSWLRDLAVCDIKGSYSVKSQDQLINYLETIKF